MSECKGCRYENSTDIREHLSVCNYCQRAYAGLDRYYHIDLYEKPKTNADRIRAMTDEELADFLERIRKSGFNELCCNDDLCDSDGCDCCIADWLQSEAEREVV